MIKPTIGRVVHYWPGPADIGQPNAALIAYVHDDRHVNLAAFDTNGNAVSHIGVTLHQEGDERPERQFAEWMPYQKGQAAKTEELEAKMAAPAPTMEEIPPAIGDVEIASPAE